MRCMCHVVERACGRIGTLNTYLYAVQFKITLKHNILHLSMFFNYLNLLKKIPSHYIDKKMVSYHLIFKR